MSQTDLAYEQQRLVMTLKELRAQLAELRSITEGHRRQVRVTRRSMWEDLPHAVRTFEDAVELVRSTRDLAEKDRSYERYRRAVLRLERMVDAPYFGRMDFREAGEERPEQVYIGIASLVERATGSHLVYDWRAPICSIFYDFDEIGPAEYLSEGGQIRGEITLKRQYKVAGGRLDYFFDSGLKIDDEILMELLGRHADDKMRTVVTSIQREQNRAIRDDHHALLIVYGPAGSGKTSIALHRVAYLLYRHRGTLHQENVVIFSPNSVFSDYISNVLPDLGEENVLQTTFDEYVGRALGPELSIENRSAHMEFVLNGAPGQDGEFRRAFPQNSRPTGIHLKASREFLQVLVDYVRALVGGKGIAFWDVIFAGKTVLAKETMAELYHKSYSYLPVSKRLEKIKRRVLFLLEPLQKARVEEIKERLSQGSTEPPEEIAARSRKLVAEEVALLTDEIARWASFNLLVTYAALWRDPQGLKTVLAGAGAPGDLLAAVDVISAQTLEALEQRRLWYEDVAPLLYLKGELEGVPALDRIQHVVIDEAQDYSPVQYAVIRRLFPRSRMTVLGDLNQSIHPYTKPVDPGTIADVLKSQSPGVVRLRKSYRSTAAIGAFCRAILGSGHDVELIERPGDKPHLICVQEGDPARAIAEDIEPLRQQGASVAVICKTAGEAARASERLRAYTSAALIRADDKAFRTGTLVMPSYLAKGLEFDAVLVYDAGEKRYAGEMDRRLLYTVCSRALHHLWLYHRGRPSPLLSTVDRSLYEARTWQG